MITAVDTNVLLDVFVSGAPHHAQSQERLIDAYDRGAILVCDVVYAELVPAFRDRSSLDKALREINATVSPIDTAVAYESGLRWASYRQAGGSRERIIADFLIGAHAVAKADTLLTRDRASTLRTFPNCKNSNARMKLAEALFGGDPKRRF